jgi:hypothetical protein
MLDCDGPVAKSDSTDQRSYDYQENRDSETNQRDQTGTNRNREALEARENNTEGSINAPHQPAGSAALNCGVGGDEQPGYDARLRVGPNTSTALGPNRSIVFNRQRSPLPAHDNTGDYVKEDGQAGIGIRTRKDSNPYRRGNKQHLITKGRYQGTTHITRRIPRLHQLPPRVSSSASLGIEPMSTG